MNITFMSQRVTVTLSDELYQELQAIKAEINVSGVFQAAIEEVIRMKQIKTKNAPTKEKMIERLRMEKREANKIWKETGFADGVKDAEELSYEEFRAIEKNEVSEDIREWIENRHIQYLENPDEDLYIEGWIEGALSIWDEIKAEI